MLTRCALSCTSLENQHSVFFPLECISHAFFQMVMEKSHRTFFLILPALGYFFSISKNVHNFSLTCRKLSFSL